MTISKDSCKPTKLLGLELESDHNDICNMPTLGHDALKHEYCFQLTAVMSCSLEQNVIQSGNEDFKETSPVSGIAVCILQSRSTTFGYSEGKEMRIPRIFKDFIGDVYKHFHPLLTLYSRCKCRV